MPGFFHRKKGSSSTHKAPVQPWKALVKSTMSSATQTTPADVDQCCVEQSEEVLRGSVTADEINSPTVFGQSSKQVGPLENQFEREMGDITKNKEPPIGERSASPPEINPHLFPHNNAPDQVLKSRELVQKDTFFFELAEIDEGLSKLKAGPITINDSLIAKIPINEHVTSEEVKEAARVSQVLEEVSYANSRAATSETQTIQALQQQGSWKRLNKADLPSKPVENSSTIESVLEWCKTVSA